MRNPRKGKRFPPAGDEYINPLTDRIHQTDRITLNTLTLGNLQDTEHVFMQCHLYQPRPCCRWTIDSQPGDRAVNLQENSGHMKAKLQPHSIPSARLTPPGRFPSSTPPQPPGAALLGSTAVSRVSFPAQFLALLIPNLFPNHQWGPALLQLAATLPAASGMEKSLV